MESGEGKKRSDAYQGAVIQRLRIDEEALVYVIVAA